MAKLAAMAKVFITRKAAARKTKFPLCPRNINSSRCWFPAVRNTESNAKQPQANASPSEISWLPRYDRFFVKPHTRFSATSSGTNTPVEVRSEEHTSEL